jgi:hypothetical protein
MNRRLSVLLLATVLSAGGPVFANGGNSGSGGGGGNSGSGGGEGGEGGGGGGEGGDDDGDNSGPGGGGDDDDDNDDQYRARDAVDKGKAESLKTVLKIVRRRVKGDVVDVKLRRSSGRLTYRIKVLERSGALVTVTVDATTGRVLRVAGGN